MSHDEERFWSKVHKIPNGCWEWTCYTTKKGYGVFRVQRKSVLAHRYSLLITGNDPGELCALHKCDNPKCVNPNHLFLDTRAKNTEDMVQKGRQVKGHRVASVKLTAENVARIRKRYAEGGISQRALAKEFGVSHPTLQCVLDYRTWKHVP